ncbi:MAG: replication-relaxation family protein, partial [Thermoanaerobaculia bacterium]
TSYWCVGEIGIGKSNHVLGPLYQALRSPLPVVVFDGAGTLTTNVLNAVACAATRRLAYADEFPHFRRQAEMFVLRHPLLVFGDGQRHLSIDLLRRQRLPDGRLETLENVATRTYQVFNRLFADDADKRVRFRRVAMSVITILSAAGRPIREYKDLLGQREGFLAFCLAESERLGVEPDQRRFLDDQVRAFLALTRLPKTAYRSETESTDNALNYFYTSPGADYVNEQTLDIPWLLGTGGKLLISHVLPDLTLATVLFRAYDSVIRTWVRGREPRRFRTPYGIQVIDEPFWIDSGVSNDWAVQRNKRWSVLLLHQRAPQLDRVVAGLSDDMHSYAKLQGQFRPSGPDALKVATDLAYRLRRFRPDSLLIPYRTTSSSETKGLAEGLSDTWSETRSRAETYGTSHTDTESQSAGESADHAESFDPLSSGSRGYRVGSGTKADRSSGTADGASESETDGNADSKGGQRSSTTSRGTSAGWTEQIHFVPIAEQALDFAQEILRSPDHVLFLSYQGKTRRLLLNRQREYPAALWGVPVAEQARAFQQDVARLRLRERGAFEPGGSTTLTKKEALTPTPSHATPTAPPVPAAVAEPAAPTPPPEAPRASPQPQPPLHLVEGADGQRRALGPRDTSILSAAADWRFVSLDSLRLDPERFGGYSGLADRVKTLCEAGLVDRLQPPAARGTGSNPVYYILARRGAEALATLTGRSEAALVRIVENVARTRTAVERNELGQLHHQLAVANLLALASAGVRGLPGGEIALTRFDKEVNLEVPTSPVDAHLTAAFRARLFLTGGQERMTLRPDGLVVVRTDVEGQHALQPLLLEIETGRKETGFEELAHAATLRAYAARAAKVVPELLRTLGLTGVRPFRLLYVAATPALEARLAVGVKRALEALQPRDRDLVLLTSLDRVHPRVAPRSRAERAAALAAKADRFFAPVWRTADREERVHPLL